VSENLEGLATRLAPSARRSPAAAERCQEPLQRPEPLATSPGPSRC